MAKSHRIFTRRLEPGRAGSSFHQQVQPQIGVNRFFQKGDGLDAERAAQREEFLRRQRLEEEETAAATPKQFNPPSRPVAKAPKAKGKVETQEEKIKKTRVWMVQTFPNLFGKSVPLNEHILRDLKAHHKAFQQKKKYPPDLQLRSVLSQYLASPEYLACLEEGTPRYNLKGQEAGLVTKEEEQEAKNLLKKMKQ